MLSRSRSFLVAFDSLRRSTKPLCGCSGPCSAGLCSRASYLLSSSQLPFYHTWAYFVKYYIRLPRCRSNEMQNIKLIWGILLESLTFFLCALPERRRNNISRLPSLHREGEIVRILPAPCIAARFRPIKLGKKFL